MKSSGAKGALPCLTVLYPFGRLILLASRAWTGGGLVKFFVSVWLFFLASAAFAQQSAANGPPQTGTPVDTTSNPVTLVQPLEIGHNFFNFYLFANGIYDSNSLQAAGSPSATGWGIEAGGGVTGVHEFSTGSLSLNYRGGYRDYQTSAFSKGTDQNLSFQFRKALTRRWTLLYNQSAGIYLYGGTYFGLQPSETNFIQTNPFGTETRFLSSAISLSYQQTRRLSYSVEGSFFLSRYNTPGSIGYTGVSGSGSVYYRFSRRTTLSGTFSHTYMTYQRGVGTTQVNSAYVTLSRDLMPRWHLGLSGGFSRVNSAGTLVIPVPISIFGLIFTAYEVGAYNETSYLPYAQGTLSHTGRRTLLTITGGESTTPGNGFFLTARTLGASGFYSYTMSRQTNLSFGGAYSRLSSVSNTVSSTYTTSTFSASLGHNLTRHLGLNLRYDFVDYGVFGGFSGRTDNRFSFGFVFNSKNVPVTLF